ncbi:hypothetical protein GMORB2_6697 [Geosmithia morbida]|uniref:Uncharacterized protein n=1 Tax=Geosmithia morbida TaxID=1094350 RepID=A0A9P4YY59_9HYPO|nr:uncharacterized protein GMORB2_6697 [Geosmithia morbida]KAF4123149.1 hypothetical protein GMORB2_6697 [Geosmithia morbida]
MAQQPTTTPVKVPSSAASYTPATLDPDLRSQINALLLRDGHVTKIQESLLHSLNSHSSNWPTIVRSHALSLLRSGQVTSYPELLRRVLEDVRTGTAAAAAAAADSTTTSSANGTNGDRKKLSTVNGNNNMTTGGGGGGGGGGGTTTESLALPQEVIDEALRVTRESLDAVCEVDDSGSV